MSTWWRPPMEVGEIWISQRPQKLQVLELDPYASKLLNLDTGHVETANYLCLNTLIGRGVLTCIKRAEVAR